MSNVGKYKERRLISNLLENVDKIEMNASCLKEALEKESTGKHKCLFS